MEFCTTTEKIKFKDNLFVILFRHENSLDFRISSVYFFVSQKSMFNGEKGIAMATMYG